MGFWKIIGITFLVLIISVILIVVVGGFILYNFVPLHIVSVCIYEDGVSIPIQCISDVECQDNLNQLLSNSEALSLPDELKNKLSPVIQEAVLCVENYCFMRKVLLAEGEGIASNYIETDIPKTKVCEGNKIDIKVYGKEIWNFYKNNKDKFK